MHIPSRVALASLAGVALLALTACNPSDAERAEQANVERQMNVKVRATEEVPAPVINHYAAREAVADFMTRTDQRGQVWYVYKVSRATGEVLKAYTSSIYPQSVCSFMTPPEEIKREASNSPDYHVTTAMALDGLYYKGGECGTFFFDLVTGALVVLDEDSVVEAYDQPLDVEVEVTAFRAEDPELVAIAEERAAQAAAEAAARDAAPDSPAE